MKQVEKILIHFEPLEESVECVKIKDLTVVECEGLGEKRVEVFCIISMGHYTYWTLQVLYIISSVLYQ